MLPLPCMLVCSFVCANRTRDRGCSKHPVFPAPSDFEEGRKDANLGRDVPREGETVSTSLRGAKRRSNPSIPALRRGLLRCARNDEERAVARMSAATSGDHSDTAPDIASLIRATSNKLDCFAAFAMTLSNKSRPPITTGGKRHAHASSPQQIGR